MPPLPSVPRPLPTSDQIKAIGTALSEAAIINVRLMCETMSLQLDGGVAMQSMLFAGVQVVVSNGPPPVDEVDAARRGVMAKALFDTWMGGFKQWSAEWNFDSQDKAATAEPSEQN